MNLLDMVKSRLGQDEPGREIAPDDPHYEAYQSIHAFLTEITNDPNMRSWYFDAKPQDYASGRAILESDRHFQVHVLHALMERIAWYRRNNRGQGARWYALYSLYRALMARNQPFTYDDLFHQLAMVASHTMGNDIPLGLLLKQVERYASQHELTEEMRTCLSRLRPDSRKYGSTEDRQLARKIDQLLGVSETFRLLPGSPWADTTLKDLAALPEAERQAWEALLTHASTAEASHPSVKWLKDAEGHLSAVGYESLEHFLPRWFETAKGWATDQVSDPHAVLLKGLIWYGSLSRHPSIIRAIGDLGEWAFKKIPGVGPRSVKVGNACLYALGQMAGPEAIAQLTRLQLRVKNRTAQNALAAALEQAARREGLSPDELEEISVPTYGLDDAGRIRETFGEFTAEASIEGMKLSDWRWITPEGKTQKSVPAKVKADFADELKALKTVANDLQKMLPAQRDRIERLYLTDRSIPLTLWRERYLEHPLLAGLTRRLVWQFRTGDRSEAGIPHEGEIVDTSGRPLDGLTDETQVRLWHPIGFDPETTLAWRVRLEALGITQPFKQAHREVYVLTDAELNTRTYSNRFAAHILKQHQFKALCDQKGWSYHLQGGWDNAYDSVATLRLSQGGMNVEFWVDLVDDSDAMTEMGIFLYVSTDQVRFCSLAGDPRPLTEVPALLFSEIMRHVDLFVGVASIGNDPAWQDRGELQNRYTDYWQSYSFGELNATAATRKEVLARLLPRLKIAGRCALEGRFLHVRGDLRTYKIHLGSGNILMEPNNQYLCIVADRKGAGKEEGGLFLPFEGDATLSLILSKAFLLAEDMKITDPTIVSQIGRR
ncbi:MAG: DUF4132 domain-containing protein [Armatimonadetes bacterium]|nr:DUF4132 domain-containing protein [Armatimonadota bacterium]